MVDWRAQTPREAAVLDAALQFDFPGRDEVAAQVIGARVRDDCGCGCGSLKVEVESDSALVPAEGAIGEVYGRDDAGALMGLFFFVGEGRVQYVECYGLEQDPVSLPLPKLVSEAVNVIC